MLPHVAPGDSVTVEWSYYPDGKGLFGGWRLSESAYSLPMDTLISLRYGL